MSDQRRGAGQTALITGARRRTVLNLAHRVQSPL
jgi:hypothetical protein